MTATIDLPPAMGVTTANMASPGAQNFTDSQAGIDTHDNRAVGEPTSEGGHVSPDNHCCGAPLGPILADPLLGMAADVLDDLERVRIANENRLRAFITPADVVDSDGVARGFGLTLDHPDMARLAALVDDLKAAEHRAILNLQRAMRKHPLGQWVKDAPGVGEKQAARLLAVVRDPFWNDLHGRPRTVSELWAYCGLHVLHPGSHTSCDTPPAAAAGVAPRRQRGQRSNWNEDARKRAWLIAASCVKQPAGTRYRQVYDETRVKYADAVHAAECIRCGPSGKPALAGSPLSLGHQHARALRAIAKAVLKDLWRVSAELHAQKGAPA
ncbi:hypothetical protein [Mycobacteroides abscessus]|uniref:hypothetical protein n=1 Tax=Mycobacteroides abscessus TaxID=36809 RepID=UPI00192E5ECE|nr:hypothetical protein [Mycobacteroides abscessus]